ncbi:MAG TPA: DUF4783 domain-containing protein [Bacteroidia bacterium]|nr:DUF4783 domain-containing protein [Bacteroidia bacterium]
MKTILSILIFSFLSFDVADDITTALKYGKYQDIYKYLDEKVIVRILDKEDLLSKEQCTANLNLFFEKNPIRSFTLIQNTNLSANAQFVYGTIDTGSNKYKVSILIKKSVIVQLRIDYFE